MSGEDVAIIQNGKLASGSKAADIDTLQDASVQRRVLKDADVNISSLGGLPTSFWFHRHHDELIPPWWSPARDIELRHFWMQKNNDILQGAISSMVKKFKAMSWLIEGPQRVVNRYQQVLSDSEFWKGWGALVSKTLTDFLTQDKGAFWELLGAGDLDGPIVGPVLGIAHLDSRWCQLTGDLEFPVIFHSTKTGKAHKLHTTRVAHIVDMPSPNEQMYDTGFCAVSRVVGSSEILLKINKYKNEKLDDLPEAGLLVLNNVLPEQWEDVKAGYGKERRRLGQEIWTNIMTLFSIDPAQPATAELISFANLPDAFDELTSTNIYLNIIALAFGVDTREFWPITGGSLGTATESEVMHQKARGKGVGDIISTLERIINWMILPESATFRFDFKDDEEDMLSAEIDATKTNTIMSMWIPSNNELTPTPVVTSLEIRQMLADNVSYFKEDFLLVDITDDGEATDIELDKQFGPWVTIDHKGRIKSANSYKSRIGMRFDDSVALAAENYRKGEITAETAIEFALGELLSKEIDI